jgi:hypothetical protein
MHLIQNGYFDLFDRFSSRQPEEEGIRATMAKPNGEIVKGDLTYDGRVILYIIKGIEPLISPCTRNTIANEGHIMQPTRRVTSTTSNR